MHKIPRASQVATPDGRSVEPGRRTGAIIWELCELRDKIETAKKGRLEIIIDFKDSFFTISLREVRERTSFE